MSVRITVDTTTFDPVAATSAYLATIPADARARSDAYFEGGYWIYLWNFLITVTVMLFPTMRSALIVAPSATFAVAFTLLES